MEQDYKFNITLRENPQISDTDLTDVTDKFVKWKHSTRAIGGNWLGEGEYESTHADTNRFFLENLGRRLVVSSGGIDWWEGQIVRMEYQRRGQRFIRSMEDMANAVKVIYSKVGDNLLTNGDVESGAWDQVGVPTVAASRTEWYARGTTAMYIETASTATSDTRQGVQPHATGGSIIINPNTAYTCSAIVNVLGGTWALEVQDFATGKYLGKRETAGCGRTWLQCSVADANEKTATQVQFLCAASAASAYIDGAIFRTAPVRSETEWFTDTDSIDAYGRIEGVLLEREMSDDEADGAAERELAESSWMRTEGPRKGKTFSLERMQEDRLIITCMGMSWTMAWKYALTDGTDDADAHITALVDETEFIASADGVIDTNAAEVYLDAGNPTTVWDQIEKVVEVGDGSGAVWMAGVYPGKEFRYQARPTVTQYQYSEGNIEYYGGGWVPPLEFEPHWCYMTDMPIEPVPAGSGASDIDDPRKVWLDQVWFIYDKGKMRLEWETED